MTDHPGEMPGHSAPAHRSAVTPGPEPRIGLLKNPWTSDALFWIAFALFLFFGIAGVRNAIRLTSGPFGTSSLWWAEILTLSITMGLWLVLILIVPALIRQAIRRSRRRKALASGMATADPGWHIDPLDSTRYRWWNGNSWEDIVAPAPVPQKRGTVGVFLLAAVLAGPVAIFTIWGLAGTGRQSAPSSSPGQESNPNTALAVEVALESLVASTEDFLTTPVNPDNLAGSMRDAYSKLPAVETDYEYFTVVVNAVTSQDQLGPGAPSLASLKTLDSEMGKWLTTRLQYLQDLQPCQSATSNLSYANCADPVFTRYETALQDTMIETGEAFQAVFDSLNES